MAAIDLFQRECHLLVQPTCLSPWEILGDPKGKLINVLRHRVESDQVKKDVDEVIVVSLVVKECIDICTK